MPLLQLQSVTLAFGGPPVLDRIDLVIERGERLCLLGRNGAGKSTLLKVVQGLLEPDDGSVTMASRPVSEMGQLGYVPQDDALHRGLTVGQSFWTGDRDLEKPLGDGLVQGSLAIDP